MHDYSKRSRKKRLRFRDWLLDQLDTEEIEGVRWIDRERGLFKIPWTHGSHRNWNVADVEIFRQWAIYSGKYDPSRDVKDHRKWKTNFRCTLNALPDFKEVRNESFSRGPRTFKIYSLKSTGKAKKEQSGCAKEERRIDAFDHNLTDKEIVQMVDEMTNPRPIIKPTLQKPIRITKFPAFETLVLGKSTGMSPFPHTTPWFLAAWNAMAVDQHVEKPELKKFDDESAEESGSEGVQMERLVKERESREIRNHERALTDDDLHGDQEIIDLVDKMSADSDSPSTEEPDGTEEPCEEGVQMERLVKERESREIRNHERDLSDDDLYGDQEIINLVDKMSADSDSPSTEELDGTEEPRRRRIFRRFFHSNRELKTSTAGLED